MAKKSDIYKVFENFQSWAERHSGRKILAVQTDNALEFCKLGRCLTELGIVHRHSVPYSHQQMGHVERRHRHIVDTSIALLHHAKLLPSMSEFRVTTACYLYNRNPTPILQGRSPLKALFGKVPEYDKMKVFGCVCYPCLRPYRAHKLDLKSKPCVFVGYSVENNEYLYLEPESHRIYSSRDVVFDEVSFSLNSCFSRDSSCKNSTDLGKDFWTEDSIGDFDSFNSNFNQTGVTPDSSGHHISQLRVSPDPLISDNPGPDTQTSNDGVPSPTVLASLSDNCSNDPILLIPEPENNDIDPIPPHPNWVYSNPIRSMHWQWRHPTLWFRNQQNSHSLSRSGSKQWTEKLLLYAKTTPGH